MGKKKQGFSLIELLVVCLIIAILSGIALPNYRRSVERTRVAEALTLLRSMYDSCERLAWERGKDSCFAGINAGVVTFPKMDILVKGTFSEGGTILTTENFVYALSNNAITAWSRKGTYSGAGVKFDGQLFTCITPDVGGEKDRACDVWGSITWNQ